MVTHGGTNDSHTDLMINSYDDVLMKVSTIQRTARNQGTSFLRLTTALQPSDPHKARQTAPL
jgi:hypothetical protein